MYFLGIDVGSLATKAVLMNAEREIVSAHIVRTGADMQKAIALVSEAVCHGQAVSTNDIEYVVSTGYGRKSVARADKNITEITAHGNGARYYFPNTRLVLDIGGQDTKVISISATGEIDDFIMNDKCAAGTGRFLEVMAGILEIPIEKFGSAALAHQKVLKINSTCTVFAESEVISLISRRETIANIAFAIHDSVVDRICSLAKQLPVKGAITLGGGVSLNNAVQTIIKNRLATAIHIPPNPQILGALGAALVAHKHAFRAGLHHAYSQPSPAKK